MFCPIVPPHRAWIEWNWLYIISGNSYMYISTFMVLWFMRRKYLHNPTLFFAHLWLPPFEEDLDLHFNTLEFPSCKNGLYQVWLKLAKCFILKDSLQYTHVKIPPPLLCTPQPTLGLSALCQKAFMQMWNTLAQWFLRRRFLNDLPIFAFLSPLWIGWIGPLF
jgi:hypothetical protein